MDRSVCNLGVLDSGESGRNWSQVGLKPFESVLRNVLLQRSTMQRFLFTVESLYNFTPVFVYYCNLQANRLGVYVECMRKTGLNKMVDAYF